MKKAGIVVGVSVLILTLVLYFIYVKITSDKEETYNSSKQTQVTQNQSVNLNGVSNIDPNPVIEQPKETKNITSNNTNDSNYVFVKLNEEDLGSPKTTREEVMVVSNKGVTLMDSNHGTPEGKQLVFTADLLYSEGLITLYLAESAYRSIDIGDKLKVIYSIFENSSGVKFPVIVTSSMLVDEVTVEEVQEDSASLEERE